jgi:Na+/phosphate symporter
VLVCLAKKLSVVECATLKTVQAKLLTIGGRAAFVAKKDLAKYEKEVEKLFAAHVDELDKALKHCSDLISKRALTLCNKINSMQIPDAMDEQEIEKIPDIIKEIVKNQNTKLNPKVAQLTVHVSADADERTVWVGSVSTKGFVSNL